MRYFYTAAIVIDAESEEEANDLWELQLETYMLPQIGVRQGHLITVTLSPSMDNELQQLKQQLEQMAGGDG